MLIKTLIKHLPEPFREMAINNQILQGNKKRTDINLSCGKSQENFNWKKTPEGYLFWRLVSEREFECEHVLEILEKFKKEAIISLENVMNEINNL
jgi:hypothetical protein